MEPTLSIITINFNNNEGLKQTMASVLPQLNDKVEYLVIDGGSSDGSAETIKSKASQLTYYCSEKDNGIYNAMNKGVANAKGEYLLFLNSGDILFSPTIIAQVLPLLDGTDIVYGDIIFHNSQRDVLVKYPDVLYADNLLKGSLPHPGSFIRRELLEKTPYNESLRICADWEFFAKKIVVDGCSTKHIPLTISIFMEDGISSVNKELTLKERNECIPHIFSPCVIRVCEEWRAYSNCSAAEEFAQIAKTRKLHRRIKPLLRAIIRINNIFSSERHH
jgi:glycosyltransferase